MEHKQVIWKYPVKPEMTLDLPMNAELLTIQMQGNEPMLWVRLTPIEHKEQRRFRAIPTGEAFVGDRLHYIATFQVDNLVFHMFEERLYGE